MESLKSAFNYVKQNRWKVLGASTAVSVGVWYYTASQRRQRQIEAYQKSQVLHNATEITKEVLSNLVPQLHRRLNEVSRMPEILEQVRRTDLARDEKIDLWNQLKLAGTYISFNLY